MAADPVFLDTNVLIYVSRPISQQVLREYLAVATRPQATAPPLPRATALADIRRFRASFEIAADNPSVLDRLLQLLATHSVAGKQVHDANVVATMLDHGVHRLLSFNTADFRPFIGLITLVPLATV